MNQFGSEIELKGEKKDNKNYLSNNIIICIQKIDCFQWIDK